MDRNSGFISLIDELKKPRTVRKGFIQKRKNLFSISDTRINELYDRYFSGLSKNHKTFSIKVDLNDFEEIVYLLRVYFRLWIEIKGNSISIYQDFPKRFMVIREVNPENHPHTPISIPAGTIMEISSDAYGLVNYNNGIPLTGKLLAESEYVSEQHKPALQINYSFIEALH